MDLEKNFKILKRISSGIYLDPQFYSQFKKNIFSNYMEQEVKFIKFLFEVNKNDFLPYISLFNHFDYHFPVEITKTSVSTAKKSSSSDKSRGKSGLSLPDAVQKGSRGCDSIEYKELKDLPIDLVPELLQKRKDDFGIWISQEAIRHFESLTCSFNGNDPIFQKIENYFTPVYGSNNWATPIGNEKKEELGICFGIQFTKYGFLKLHLNGNKDTEIFIQDFFQIFTRFLTDEELVKFLEMLTLGRAKKPAFYVHDARTIGPKKVVDEDFKGAHVKVNEVHWFGEIKYDVRIDYSKRSAPHIEGEGPIPQVGNFMKLIDGCPEFIANLSEVREIGYRTRDKVHENYIGIGSMSNLMIDHGQTLQVIQKDLNLYHMENLASQSEIEAKLFGLDILLNSNQKITNKHLINLYESHNQEIIELKRMNLSIPQVIVEESVDIQETIKDCTENLLTGQDEILTAQEKNHQSIKERLDKLDNRFDKLERHIKQVIKDEVNTTRKQFQNNLYLVLRMIHHLPEITSKEIIQEIQAEAKISRSTIYKYLTLLQNHHLIKKDCMKSNEPGRPSHLFKLTNKTKNLIKKLKK